MLQRNRIETAQGALSEKLLASAEARKNVDYAYEDLADYHSGDIKLFAASGILESVANGLAASSFITATSVDQRHDASSAVWSLKWYAYNFHMQAVAKGERTFFNPNFTVDAGISVPMMQSFG